MSKKPTKKSKNYFVHPTAIIEDNVEIGEGTKIWHFAQVRTGAKIGQNCIVGKSVFIDSKAQIGNNCKIQNHAIIYHPCVIEDGVCIGPNVCFTNDRAPRAINPDGSLKLVDDWEVSTIKIGYGSAIGAHSVITPGRTIGQWVIVGSGSVVSRDLPDYALAYGNPVQIRGFVCKCGKKLTKIIKKNSQNIVFNCECGEEISIPKENYQLLMNHVPKKRIWLK